MSTSLLYHGFGIRGYEYLSAHYVEVREVCQAHFPHFPLPAHFPHFPLPPREKLIGSCFSEGGPAWAPAGGL